MGSVSVIVSPLLRNTDLDGASLSVIVSARDRIAAHTRDILSDIVILSALDSTLLRVAASARVILSALDSTFLREITSARVIVSDLDSTLLRIATSAREKESAFEGLIALAGVSLRLNASSKFLVWPVPPPPLTIVREGVFVYVLRTVEVP